MTTKEQIEVMQAYLDGKEIEVYNPYTSKWDQIEDPLWNWSTNRYRIKPSFEWSFPSTTYRADSYGITEYDVEEDKIELGLMRSTRKQAEDSHARMVQSNVLEQLVYWFQNEVTNNDNYCIHIHNGTYIANYLTIKVLGCVFMSESTAYKICDLLNSGEVVL